MKKEIDIDEFCKVLCDFKQKILNDFGIKIDSLGELYIFLRFFRKKYKENFNDTFRHETNGNELRIFTIQADEEKLITEIVYEDFDTQNNLHAYKWRNDDLLNIKHYENGKIIEEK